MADLASLPLRLWVAWTTHRYFRCLTAAVAGGAAALALPDTYLLPALFISMPVFLWLISRAETHGQSFWIGWWFGFAYFVAGLYWIGNALLVNDGAYAWAIPLAVGALPALLAIFIGLTALSTRIMMQRGWRTLPAFAIAWTIFEMLRGFLFSGFPWNLLGSVWTVFDATAQPAWLIGTYGLSFVTALVTAAPYALMSRDWHRPKSWAPPAAALVTIAAMAVFGTLRLNEIPTRFHDDIKLRIVQANIPQDEKWDRNRLDDNFLTYLRLSEQDARGVTAFIWPETALPYFIADEPSRQTLIGRFLPQGSVLITGAPRIERQNGEITGLWNSLFVLGDSGRIEAVYDKTHLVPFGEYLPLRPLLRPLGIDKLVFGAIDYSPGTERVNIETDELPAFTPLICYEVIFPGAVTGTGAPARWIVNVTNDGWYGDTTGPRQHLSAARLRAVEQGLPVVRAAGTGISAVFDPLGREVAALGFGRRGTVDSYLPQPATLGPYGRYGNAIVVMLLGVSAILSRKHLFRRFRRNR